MKPVYYEDDCLVMIDQTKLPGEKLLCRYDDYRDIIQAIKTMIVRGAPAIGVSAAYAVYFAARELSQASPDNTPEFLAALKQAAAEIKDARPTAVNLMWAADRMTSAAEKAVSENPQLTPAEITTLLRHEADDICAEDIYMCRAIGRNGAELIHENETILTHCNAGALATADYGTALGVIRAAQEAGKNIHVYADETRPLLQGARLTAYELHEDGIPVTLITDNMAGWMMKQGKIGCCVVGADRIAANGDTANKIGTYSVAVLAKHHGIPMYIAAPSSTVDMKTLTGDAINIEERDHNEVF
ncbi:MAG: S-methyl-5-thioribose-1-phosphate isomerase, partial [Eubacteriaceae bacterium]